MCAAGDFEPYGGFSEAIRPTSPGSCIALTMYCCCHSSVGAFTDGPTNYNRTALGKWAYTKETI